MSNNAKHNFTPDLICCQMEGHHYLSCFCSTDTAMPHIVFETTPRLSGLLDFNALMTSIHGQLVERGYARLGDLKSRVYLSDQSLAGAEPDGQFLVARLTMSNPRPPEVQREMGRVIHDAMHCAIEHTAPDFWWQCCVFVETFNRLDYLKTDSRDLGA